MGSIKILDCTCKQPLTLIGRMAGVAYGAQINDDEKNYKRGLDCVKSGHFRAMEFAEVFMTIDGYSARMIRELYTHIGGSPTRLQASTRYIDYNNFEYIVPPKIEKDPTLSFEYHYAMGVIRDVYTTLETLGANKEDIANILPMGMKTTVSVKYNARTLMDMSRQRMCNRAYWEFRDFMNDLYYALRSYSDEWAMIVDMTFGPKCEFTGYCSERFSCGKYPKNN